MDIDTRWSRRKVIRCGAGALLTAGAEARGAWAEEAKDGDFHFIQVNDLHFLNAGCVPWFEGLVRQINASPQPAQFVLVAGDLVENGTAEQFAAIRDLLKGLKMPNYVVVGNHDYGPQDDRKLFDAHFPGRINYRFDHGDWQFLALDSSDGQRYHDTKVGAPTLEWLDETLPKLDRKRPTVLFTHFPLGTGVVYRPGNADDVLARLKEHNVRAVFSGHFHGFTERKVGALTLTTDRCCSFARQNHDGTKEKGYFLCHARNGDVERTFVEYKLA